MKDKVLGIVLTALLSLTALGLLPTKAFVIDTINDKVTAAIDRLDQRIAKTIDNKFETIDDKFTAQEKLFREIANK